MDKFDIIEAGNTKLYNFITFEDKNIANAFLSLFKELYFPITEDGFFAYESNYVTINKNDNVIDCGGNFGLFANWAAEKGAQVYSFEPSILNIQFLKENRKLYPNNINIEQKAVGDLCSIVNFTECWFSPGSHLSNIDINHSCLYKTEYPVEMITLDSQFYNKIPIHYIKIDVEGAEKLVLKGAKNLIKLYSIE